MFFWGVFVGKGGFIYAYMIQQTFGQIAVFVDSFQYYTTILIGKLNVLLFMYDV